MTRCIRTTRSGCATGHGRSAIPLNAVKKLVFTPIAAPSPASATMLKPGCRAIVRSPYETSCQRLSSHGQIHTPRASSLASVRLPIAAAGAPSRSSMTR
jgi:hypothetical protein